MKILRALLALALLLTPMRALAQEAKALTADCVITSGKVKTTAAHDGDYTTAWRSERVRRPYLEFELPEGETAGYLYVCFTEMPQSWAVEERVDGKWRVVAEGGTDYLHALVELNGQNHFRIVENSGVTTRLKFNEVFVFGEGELPDWVQRWQPTAEKADLLVLATHPDDELIFFGGTIPTYAVEREKRVVVAYMYPSWEPAVAAIHAMADAEIPTTFVRISDAHETAMSLSTQKEATTLKKKVEQRVQEELWAFMRRRGWDTDEMCISYVCFEGSEADVDARRRQVVKIAKAHGALVLGTGPGALYDQKKFDTPYLRDFLLEQHVMGDVSETAAPWSKLNGVHDAVYAAAGRAFESLGKQGFIMCHLSHSYHAGACLYFTFAFQAGEDADREYATVKTAIQQAFVDSGGTLSHHHGVGMEHAPWMEQVVSEEGVSIMRSLFSATDPGNHLNPGKIIDPSLSLYDHL